jgi:hypothetical protein
MSKTVTLETLTREDPSTCTTDNLIGQPMTPLLLAINLQKEPFDSIPISQFLGMPARSIQSPESLRAFLSPYRHSPEDLGPLRSILTMVLSYFVSPAA